MQRSAVARYGALGNVPFIDSAVLYITSPASVGERGTQCFETTLS